jgi:hypothetical protein
MEVALAGIEPSERVIGLPFFQYKAINFSPSLSVPDTYTFTGRLTSGPASFLHENNPTVEISKINK